MGFFIPGNKKEGKWGQALFISSKSPSPTARVSAVS